MAKKTSHSQSIQPSHTINFTYQLAIDSTFLGLQTSRQPLLARMFVGNTSLEFCDSKIISKATNNVDSQQQQSISGKIKRSFIA